MEPPQDREVRRRRALVWTAAVLAALTALYALAGFVLIPRLARQQLMRYAQQELQAQLRVGSIRLNPFTLRAEVSDFALTTPEGAPLAGFADLQVAAALSSLWHGEVTLREVRLDQPALELAVARDGTLNWERISAAAPATAAPHEAGAPSGAQRSLALRIEALRLHAGRIHFEDHSHDRTFSTVLDPIELELFDFRSAPEFHNRLHLNAHTTAGEGFDWNAEFSLRPFASSGTLQISALQATTIAAYLRDQSPFALLGGSLDAHARYRWSSGSAADNTLSLESLSLRDLAIAPRSAPTTPWVQLPQLRLSGARVELSSHRIQIQQLQLQRPMLAVWRESNGAINLQQLLTAASAAPADAAGATSSAARSISPGAQARSTSAVESAPAPETSGASAPWALDLQKLQIEDGRLMLEDRSVQPAAKLRLSSIGLQVLGFSSAAPERPLTLELGMRIGEGGQLHLQGDLRRAAPSAHLTLDLQRLDLTALQPYLAQRTDLALYRGTVSAQAKLSYGAPAAAGALASGPQLDVSGDLSIADLAARERRGNSELANWQSLELSGVHYQRQPDALQIEHIVLRHAYGRVLIGSDGTLNIAQVLHPQRASPTPSAAPVTAESATPTAPRPAAAAAPGSGEPRMPIRIDRIDIRGSTADFTDQSVRPTFSADILGLHGQVVGLSSAPQARAQVHLSGQLDRYAPVSIDGQLNPLATTAYTDLSLNFSNIDLTIFNPYSGKFAGYSIQQGKLATQMHYHVENRTLQATHHIVIDQLEFGPATADKPAVPLPVKLAAALLKDRHGVISIDLPVSGSVDDPKFRLGPLIAHALFNLMTKAVSAPFSWLGSLIGGEEQLAYIDFAAGSAQLPASGQQKVAQLAKALAERPQLKLDIPLHTMGVADDRALAQAALAEAATAKQSELSAAALNKGRSTAHGRSAQAAGALEAAKSPHLLALEALYRSQFHTDPVYPGDSDASASGAAVTGAEGAAPSAAAASAAPAAAAATGGDPDPRVSWLEQQLLVKFLPNGAQREALGRARADAVQAAILAAGQLSAERLFLTNRISGGEAAGMSRMELQLQ